MKKCILISIILVSSIPSFCQGIIKVDHTIINQNQQLTHFLDSISKELIIESSTSSNNGIYISHSDNPKITIRGQVDSGPLVIVNGFLLEDPDLLKNCNVANIKEINLLKGEHALALYGQRAISGVILLTISNRKYRKAKRDYSANKS